MSIKHWENPSYQRIFAVRHENDELSVSFENGNTVSLGTEQLLSSATYTPGWNTLSHDSHEILVPTSGGNVEIPWTTIRLLTDKEFASYWANTAEEQSKQVGIKLRELRKKKNLSSKEVAERAGIRPQSLSRIEHGSHDVSFGTLRKILAAMGANLKDLTEVQVSPASINDLLKHLEVFGLKKDWLMKRILPVDELAQREKVNSANENSKLLKEAVQPIARIFNWSVDNLLNLDQLTMNQAVVASARFKGIGNTQKTHATAYAVYAHFISLLTLGAAKHLGVKPLPKTVEEIRETIVQNYGYLNFENFLTYVWDLGIPVIPLGDSGAFHGACWKIGERNVIVLKQVTPYQSRWLYDLAHELAHVIEHLSDEHPMIIEPEEISPFQDEGEEFEASEFATHLVLGGRAEQLAQMSVTQARGKVEYLKSAVYNVATKENVSVDALANYVAYRLVKGNNINWWGAAHHLQITDPSPAKLAKQIFLQKVDLEQLTPMDRDLVLRAVD